MPWPVLNPVSIEEHVLLTRETITVDYKLINWIKTAAWEGALIQDTYNRRYLTNGINKWSIAPHRVYDIIPSIDESIFMERWNMYFVYDSLNLKE